ncbi:MAG: UDP-2,3-diacylglucosamine diphosphatase [Bacteroidetes bacterium]|nr:UDP-2,3-diacylglucosamine diphosphatase [Bacteroidota bacterium]MBK8680975.1 UDP-2,3-diacylglucosamine diphosphatase [Bacteroidota bacterium]
MKKIYFASDFHLGIPDHAQSLEREKKIVRWLHSIKHDAAKIYLLGDIFDFWFEYKHVSPKGHVRLLGTLAELQDSGIEIEVFIGNHDMWMFGYFQQELGIPVHHDSIQFEWGGKKFFVGHGDGIGPGDHGYKFIKKVFRNKFNQQLFGLLHPTIAFSMARYWSGRSRNKNEEAAYLGEDKEWQIIYAKEILEKEHFDYFIFGHRHIVLEVPLKNNSTFYNLGDWITHFTYLVFDGEKASLLYFEK